MKCANYTKWLITFSLLGPVGWMAGRAFQTVKPMSLIPIDSVCDKWRKKANRELDYPVTPYSVWSTEVVFSDLF